MRACGRISMPGAAILACVLIGAAAMVNSAEAALPKFAVEAFGAKPNQRADSAPAARAAVAAAIKAGGGVVAFGPGTYYMMTGDQNAYAVWPRGANNVHVAGVNGKTKIIVTDPHIGFFRWDGSRGCALTGFDVDYETPPFTQGEIVAVDKQAGTFDLKIQQGYPALDAGFFNLGREWGMPIDRTERHPKYCWLDHMWIKNWTKVGEGLWRLTCQSPPNARELDVGDRYVQLARQRNHGVFGVWNSSEILMQDIVVHASPGITNGVVLSDAVVYRRFQVRFAEGSDRLITSNGDGIHVHGNRRGPVIEDCFFEGICDDGVNLNSHMNPLVKVTGPTEIVVFRASVTFRKGDSVQIVEPATGRVRAETTIVDVKGLPGNFWALKLKDPVEGMVANAVPEGGGGRGGRAANVGNVRLTGGDVMYNLSCANAGFVIRGNTFRDHRRFGLLIRSGKGVIERNTFERLCGVGILITNGMALEGPVAFDVTIRNNKLNGVGRSHNCGHNSAYGAIMVRTDRTGNKPAPQRGIRDIHILNNEILDPPRNGIYVGSAVNVEIAGNTITAGADSPTHGASEGVLIENSAGVTVKDLKFTDPRDCVRAGILIRGSTDPGEKGVAIDKAEFKLPTGVPDVLDERKPAP